AAVRRVVGGGGGDQMTLSSTQIDTRLQIIADSEAAAADDGADSVTVSGSYARADVTLGGGDDAYQGDNSGGATSGALVDVVYAGAGDDDVRTGGGNDLVYGEDGADKLYGGFGDDTLYGGEGDDQLWGNGGADALYGDAGADILRGFDGDDRLFGAEGNDQLYGENNNDSLEGASGDDTLDGGAGNDTLIGGTGLFDALEGGTGADVLTDEDGVLRAGGGSGSDSINITFSDDGGRSDVRIASGGDGIDIVALASLDRDLQFAIFGDDEGGDETGDNRDTVSMAGDYAAATVRLGGGDDTYQGDETNTPGVAKTDTVHAGSGADTVRLGVGADFVDGGSGDDKLYGGAGNDTLLGAAGEDQIYGDDGSDSIDGGTGMFDRLWGGAGVDTIADADGALLVDGGTGNDVFNLTYTDDGGQPETVRTVIGGDGLDQITLNAVDPDLQFEIYGDGQAPGAVDRADTVNMNGNYAKANVWLGGGNDTYQGDNGGAGGTRIDEVYGGDGDDTIRMGGGADVAYGETGDDRLSGGDGDDRVYGGVGNDMLWGNLGNDWAEGGDGADTLWGNEGDDMLLGDAGNDVFFGGDGVDTITGGTGDDEMTGGTGGDIFIIRQGDGFDTILDFKAGPDKLDLSDFHFANAADALSHAADSANGVVITLDDDQSVTLSGLTLQQINDTMLIV
ncbi:MAG TPA: calcium-binding protein, partial [Azospirillaceae bacterium]|nr:calcium-binding protein [Azospirillaceae bacterium]